MTWIISAASFAATVMNIKCLRACFLVWAITNSAWCAVDLLHGIYARAPLDAAYFLLALWGWSSWGRATESVPPRA